jgi:hypothetical protein
VVAWVLAAVLAAPFASEAVAQTRIIRLGCRGGAAALQRAVAKANQLGAAIIQLAPSCVYEITTPSTADEALPVITGDVRITGSNTYISRSLVAPTDFRIFKVAPGGRLHLIGLAIQNGRSDGPGGGIANEGVLLLENVLVASNLGENGGGIWIAPGAAARAVESVFLFNAAVNGGGGAIANLGTLRVKLSIVMGNTAPLQGGGIMTLDGALTRVVATQLEHNTSGGFGGALSNEDGTLTVKDSRIRFNVANQGGGIALADDEVVTLLDSVVELNEQDNCYPLNAIPGCVD